MIAAACPSVPTGPGFLTGVLRAMECLSVQGSERSFAFLGAPGGIASAFLVSAVTLLIVIFGFRLMFNHPIDFGDVTASAVKIGIALAIAVSWPAVSRVIARPVINGPSELTQWTGLADQLPERLGHVDEGIGALISWGTGRNDIRAQRTANGDYAANETATVALTDALAFGGGRTAFLVGTIGSLGLLKLLAGILIGLAPIFAGLLLFERTQGIFAGWLRTLFGILIAGAAANVLLSIELAILEPWLSATIADRQASLATPSAASELLAMTLAFSVITAGSILLIMRAVVTLEVPVARILMAAGERVSGAITSVASNANSTLTFVSNDNGRRGAQIVEGLQRIDSYREQVRSRSTNSASVVSTEVHNSERAGVRQGTGRGVRGPRRTLVSQRRDRRP